MEKESDQPHKYSCRVCHREMIRHFISQDVISVEGRGEKRIRKLLYRGIVIEPTDHYGLIEDGLTQEVAVFLGEIVTQEASKK